MGRCMRSRRRIRRLACKRSRRPGPRPWRRRGAGAHVGKHAAVGALGGGRPAADDSPLVAALLALARGDHPVRPRPKLRAHQLGGAREVETHAELGGLRAVRHRGHQAARGGGGGGAGGGDQRRWEQRTGLRPAWGRAARACGLDIQRATFAQSCVPPSATCARLGASRPTSETETKQPGQTHEGPAPVDTGSPLTPPFLLKLMTCRPSRGSSGLSGT